MASRWQRLAAGTIFPTSLAYTDANGLKQTASLVGIAPPAKCAAAIDPGPASVMRRFGCQVILRATYADGTGTLALTAGIAVMASPATAAQAETDLSGNPYGPGLRVVTFGGTTAGRFGDAQRAYLGYAQQTGPYVFLVAAGYADGRTVTAMTDNPAISSFGSGVLTDLQSALTRSGDPCKMKDIRC
jgi:hypothetical protein